MRARSVGKKFTPENCEHKTKPGDELQVHYTGRLYTDCSVFALSVHKFVLGQGEVIKGWDE